MAKCGETERTSNIQSNQKITEGRGKSIGSRNVSIVEAEEISLIDHYDADITSVLDVQNRLEGGFSPLWLMQHRSSSWKRERKALELPYFGFGRGIIFRLI